MPSTSHVWQRPSHCPSWESLLRIADGRLGLRRPWDIAGVTVAAQWLQ